MGSSYLLQLKHISRLTAWWQQLAWMVGAEIILGLLFAWAWTQGVPLPKIILGLALVSALEGGTVWVVSRVGRTAALSLITATFFALAFSFYSRDATSWVWLCIAIGGIQGFSYLQGARAMVWFSITSRRCKSPSSQTLVLASLATAIIVGICLAFAGWVATLWKYLPYAVALVVASVLLPLEWVHSRPRPVRVKIAPIHWWLGSASFFAVIGGLGRRIVIPFIILALAASLGQSSNSLTWVGGLMGIAGIGGLMIRQLWQHYRNQGHHSFGLRAPFLLGIGSAACVAAGALGWQANPHGFWIGLMLLGWLVSEGVTKIWFVAHFDGMRAFACKGQINKQRAYKEALTQLFTTQSLSMAVIYVLASFLAMEGVALLMILLCIASVGFFYRQSPKSSPSDK